MFQEYETVGQVIERLSKFDPDLPVVNLVQIKDGHDVQEIIGIDLDDSELALAISSVSVSAALPA